MSRSAWPLQSCPRKSYITFSWIIEIIFLNTWSLTRARWDLLASMAKFPFWLNPMAVQGPRSRKSRSIQDMVIGQLWEHAGGNWSTKAGKYVDDNNVLHSFHRTPLSDFLDRFVLFFFFFDRRPRIHPKDRCNVLARLATQRRETTASKFILCCWYFYQFTTQSAIQSSQKGGQCWSCRSRECSKTTFET